MTVTIVVDLENNAERFWDAFRAEGPADPYVREWWSKLNGRGVERVECVPNDAANALVEWASALPEWDEGPEYAPHPFFLAPDEDPDTKPDTIDIYQVHNVATGQEEWMVDVETGRLRESWTVGHLALPFSASDAQLAHHARTLLRGHSRESWRRRADCPIRLRRSTDGRDPFVPLAPARQ